MPKEKVRLSIDCSPEDRQRVKIMCALSEQSISEWVMDAVRERMEKETKRLPNRKTQKALVESQKGIGVERHNSIEELFEDLGI